jgi:uncharacterized membrane protein YhaH (DUF805 family)
MINYYISVLKKYAVFSGRASIKEYWYFVLSNFIIGFIIGFIEGFLGGASGAEKEMSLFVKIYYLFILIPSIAVSFRRMHDVNKSGWFSLIPIYSFILTVTSGTLGDNKYGPDPRITSLE